MNALHTILAGTALSLALMAGPVAPALAQQAAPDAPATETAPAEPAPAIDFGDDSSDWANDGECDDPRFTGTGAAEELLDADRGHDATDCSAAFAEGTVSLADPEDADVAATPAPEPVAEIDFGDDASEWANDGECDDPRFTGPGSAAELLDADILHDATDCSTAFADGRVNLVESGDVPKTVVAAGATSRIDFGDDSGEWTYDGECDDPDFAGAGMAAKPGPESRLRDASDCRAAFDLGTIWLGSASAQGTPSFDYGSDTSQWAYDGECDDPRFTGAGTDKKLLDDDMLADASDCRALEAEGQVSIRTVYSPGYAAGAPYDSSDIDFGDDSSDYAGDDECDDPRFEGPGAAGYQLDTDISRDAGDCRAAYEAGTVMLREGEV
ncbi:hypothetical protein [Devosia beringensis]|uniref:hypothetical protein n=1 Tax=Devosia beringensis TaxID=2657486 RepID=UPI00186BB24F|nr:hypothetical protein [Devosia beringensis]